MRRARVAVVADNAVCDEILARRRDVVETHRLADRFDAHNSEPRGAFHGLPKNFAFSRDGRFDAMEEAKMLAESADNAHHFDGLSRIPPDVLHHKSELPFAQSVADPCDDFLIRIANPKHALAVASLGIEHPFQESGRPT